MNAHRFRHRHFRCLTLALALLVAHGCGFTSEPDPGHGDVDQGGMPINDAGHPDQGAAVDAGVEADAFPPPVDAGAPDMNAVADASLDASPGDFGPGDGGFEDFGLDAELPDADVGLDAELPDADVGPDDLGPAPDLGPDLGPDIDPLARACHRLCATLAACRPAPDPAADAACRPACRDRGADPELIDACHDSHLAADRCHADGYLRCEAGLPPPIDPRCTSACDAFAACDFPQSPDCALECDAEPGPERRFLERCAETHTTGPCDLIGFIECASRAPSRQDGCDYACATLAACGRDPACPEQCPRDPAAYDIECIEAHLDRGACAARPYERCLAAP
ncbi:MAG: hypothetical protein R3F65_11820 [bacterium]